jgi:serine phosphatase RsbU (regulator of sigma subunit)
LRANREIEKLEPTGGVLGVHPEFSYSETEVDLQAGDLLLLYTDGVTEALNASQELFGDERLDQFLLTKGNLSAEELLNKLLEEVRRFTGKRELDDDLTLIALKKI